MNNLERRTVSVSLESIEHDTLVVGTDVLEHNIANTLALYLVFGCKEIVVVFHRIQFDI